MGSYHIDRYHTDSHETQAEGSASVIAARHIGAWYASRSSFADINNLDINNASRSASRNTVSVSRNDGRRQVLADISLDLFPREVLAIIGGSGAGKTTLARILLGLRRPDEGTVTFEGTDIHTDRRAARCLRLASGIVFQDPFSSLDPRWRIAHSVAEPLRLQHGDSKHEQIHDRVEMALRQVGLDPEQYGQRFPSDLSGGQCQRAAIARAIVNRPQVLLADEALSSLDVPARIQVLDVLRRITAQANGNKAGMSTIFISHDLGVVQHLADRILVLDRGRVVEYGETDQVLHDPVSDYTKKLLRAASW